MTPAQTAALRVVAGMIVPASAKYGVPGADDPAIQADILATLGRDTEHVVQALDLAVGLAGAPLDTLDAAGRRGLATELRATQLRAAELRAAGNPVVATLVRVVLQCYYRDDRVVRSLGLEPRPPFPKGHVLADGNWSLLDPVRARSPTWRPVT